MCVQHSPICMKENRICKLIYTHKIPLKGIKRHWNHWLPLGQDTRCLRNISIWSSSTVNHMNILPSQKKWVKFKLKKEGEGRGRAGECGRNLEMNSCSGPSGQKDAWPRVGFRAQRSSVGVPCGGKSGAGGKMFRGQQQFNFDLKEQSTN